MGVALDLQAHVWWVWLMTSGLSKALLLNVSRTLARCRTIRARGAFLNVYRLLVGTL
jgi:hypothetical protein